MDDKGFMSSGDFLLSRPLSLSIPVDSYCPRQPTLQEVLSNIAPQPWTLGAFTVYLSQNHCLEVLEFTLDAKRYTTHYQVMVERDPLTPLSPATQDCEYVKMLWVKLLDAYIAPNASREVNLPSDIRDHLLSLPCTYTPPDSAELEPAVKIIYEIMDEAVLVPFLNSVTPSRGPESVASPWTSNESMSDTYMTGSLDKRSLSPVRSRNQRDRSPPSNGSGSDVVSQSYSGPSLRHSHQSHLTAALGLSRLPANISGLSGTSSGEAIESMTDDSIDSPSPSGSALEPRTPPNTPPTSNASPRSNSSWKKMGDKLRWKKSRSGHGSGSNTGSSRYPIDREGGEEPGLEGRQVTSSPNDNFSIIPTPIIAPTEYPIAGYSSHRQERKKTAFVHGGTSLRLSESWGSPELVAHPGLPVEITSHRPFLPTSAAAQRLYYESDEELLKYEKSKLGKIEGVKKDGVAAEGYFSVGNRVASSENDSTKFLAKRMQVAGPQPFYIPAKVPEDEEIPHVPVPTVSTPGSVAQDDKSMVDTSVESSVMDFDFETDNGVWISAHPTAHESRTSLSTTTTAASTLMDNQYSQYSHGALTLDTSVASSAASTTSSAANMMPSTASIQSASTATSSDIYGWEEEQGRKVSLESGNQDWDYVRRIPQRGRIVGPRARGGVKDHQFRRTDGKRRSLLYRVLNLSSSRSAAASSISSITGLQGAEDRLVETDVNRDFSTLEDPSKKLALSDPEEEEEEEEEEDRTGLTECLTLKSDTENTGFESQFLKSSSVTKILETQSVQPSQFGIKSKKEEDASGPGDISIGVPEDPAGIGSQKSSAVQQELGQGSRPSNHAYVDDANDSKTEDSTLLKSSNTSACSDSDPDTTEPQHASITGYTTGSSDKSDEIYDDRMAVTETFASTEITESLDSPGCQFRLSEMDEGLLPPEMYGRHRRTSDASDTSKSSTAPSTALSISTIASLSSMSSILGPEEAAERLVEVLFGDATLRELYHEALSRVTVERLERNLRRLLKLFAIELRKEAETPEQRAAAGFVRNRARNSAHIICNKLGRGKFVVELKSLNPTIELTLPTQDALGEISDNNSNSDSPDDDPAELGQLERFIVTARAFESLRSNLRLFIYPDEAGGMNNKAVHESSAENITQGADHLEKNDLQASDCQVSGSEGRANLTDDWRTVPNPENIPWEDMAKVGNEVLPQEYVASLKYMLSKFATAAQALWRREPEIPDGKRRVRWKCKCGQLLYDDFEEKQIGAAKRLESSLNSRNSSSNASTNSSNDSGRSTTTTTSFISNSIQSLRKILEKKKVELPRHAPRTISGSHTLNNPPAPPTEMLYLLLCYSEGIYATKLLQLPIADLKSDNQLFTVLRSHYKSMRGQWRSFISFRTLTGIRFVRFEMYKKSQSVDIRKKDDIPPDTNREYKYAPVPIDIIPPVGENQLMHFFHHPEHAEDEPACLDRFPKKLRERFAVCSGKVTGTGWGLHLVEGWDSRKTWVMCFVLFGVGSSLWGILWTVFKKSVQDAFAISGFTVALALLTIGFTQTMAENMNG